MRLLKILGIVLLVAGLLTALVAGVGAQASQTWFFTDGVADGVGFVPIFTGTPTVNHHRIMTKGAVGGEGTIVTLKPGERVWFYSDETAVVDVAFPGGTGNEWSVSHWVKTTTHYTGTRRVSTRLHYISPDGTAATLVKGTHHDIEYHADIQKITRNLRPDEGFTVVEGGRLVIEVLWSSTATGNLEIHCNPAGVDVSSVTSPPSDPGYPVPELSTIILFSMGLLLLGGYTWLKRRRPCPQTQC